MTPNSAREALDDVLANRAQQVIDLACELIAAPSPNPPGDETAPVEVILRALETLGLPQPRVVAAMPHRPNLVLTIEGELPGPHLAFCGHTDTKPAGDAIDLWRTDPWTPVIVEDRLYGLGSTDMKGAVAAMVFAAAALHAVRRDLRGSISFLFTTDEELGSRYGAIHLVEAEVLAGVDAIVLGEPSGLLKDWDAIRTVSRGVACFRVLIGGTQMHSSVSDVLPSVNAVEAMARVMTRFREVFQPRYPEHPLCPNGPTINIEVKASGGVGYGVVPGNAEFWTDVRLVPGMRREDFVEDVETALQESSSELRGASMCLKIDEQIGWSEATEIFPDHPAVIACQRASAAVLGNPLPLAYFPGGTDAVAFQAIAGIPTLAAFGPGLLLLAHGPNEWVSCSSVRQAMRMYARAALEFGYLANGVRSCEKLEHAAAPGR